MAAGDLTSLANALAWVGLSADINGVIARLITAVSTQIQTYIGYQIAQAPYVRTFNGVGSDRIMLNDRPVISVSAVTVDTVSVPLSIPPAPGFLFDAKFVYIVPGGCWTNGFSAVDRFNRGIQNCKITFTAGYAATPGDIEQACLAWIGSAYASLGVDAAARMIRAGDTEIEFGNATTTLGGNKQTLIMPPAIAAILGPYQRAATSS